MSRILLCIEAQDCNAWASDVVHGIPSPLSIAMYLRAIFAGASSIGFGEALRFAMGLYSVANDTGRYSSRPLLTYAKPGKESEPTPLFDEHRCSMSLRIVVDTTKDPSLASQESNALGTLQSVVRTTRFLGGNVVRAQVREVTSTQDLIAALRGTRVYTDESPSIFRSAHCGADVLRAALLANLPQEVQERASKRWGIPPEIWAAVNRRWLRVMPLGYRRLSDFRARKDARFVLNEHGMPKASVHAFVESVYGVIDLVGAKKAFDLHELRKSWWSAQRASSLDSPMVFCVKGDVCHE